jgi:hypothetical protein
MKKQIQIQAMMKKKRKPLACWQKLKQKVAAVAVVDAGPVVVAAVVVTSKDAVPRVAVAIADPVVAADNPTTLKLRRTKTLF